MDPTTLLEHREFVRSVAGALLPNDADVEDAVQDTYVAALQADPPRSGRVRPWLRGITRNVAKKIHRSRTRRTRRERVVAKPEGAAAECTEQLRRQPRVVEEVLELDPVFRDVLLLRYYENLPPRAIAQKVDVPVNTVRSRYRRGMEKLRRRFDHRFGRKAWSAGLAALFAPQAAAATGAGVLVAAVLGFVLAGTAWICHGALFDNDVRTPDRTIRDSSAGSASPFAAVDSKPASVTEATPVHNRFGSVRRRRRSGERRHGVDPRDRAREQEPAGGNPRRGERALVAGRGRGAEDTEGLERGVPRPLAGLTPPTG